MKQWIQSAIYWLKNDQSGMGTIEVIMIIIILIALVLMFKDTVVDFVAGILGGIESQSGTFDPTIIAK